LYSLTGRARFLSNISYARVVLGFFLSKPNRQADSVRKIALTPCSVVAPRRAILRTLRGCEFFAEPGRRGIRYRRMPLRLCFPAIDHDSQEAMMAGDQLFADLPEHGKPLAAAARDPAGATRDPADAAGDGAPQQAPRLREPQRDQIELRAVDIESLIGDDHPARVIWPTLPASTSANSNIASRRGATSPAGR